MQVSEPPGEEYADHQTTAKDDKSNATVEIGEHGHHFVDFLVIVLLQGFVEEENDAGTNAQLCHTEETHDVHEHARETDELCAEAVEEYLSGEESQEQGEDVENHAHLDIHDTSMYSLAHLS